MNKEVEAYEARINWTLMKNSEVSNSHKKKMGTQYDFIHLVLQYQDISTWKINET